MFAGILIGIGIVAAFVFLGSEGTIDAPRINQGATTGAEHQRSRPKPHKQSGDGQQASAKPKAAKVEISSGAPPASGPAHLDFQEGDRVALEVDSDATVGIELLGYGITTTVQAGTPSQISFTATRTGNFPLIVSASHIAVAQIRVDG